MILLQQTNQSSFLMDKIERGGGPIITGLLLLILGICVLIAIRGFIQIRKTQKQSEKNIRMLNGLGLFALVYGVFGQLLGLVNILDEFSGSVEVSAGQLAMGLKFTIIPTLLGSIIFLIAKAVTLLLTWLQPVR